jgi:hypothetical protein
MPTSRARRRRALELLASYPEGCTEALMLAHGLPAKILVELIETGDAIATNKHIVDGDRTLQVTRLKITTVGRTALARLRWP